LNNIFTTDVNLPVWYAYDLLNGEKFSKTLEEKYDSDGKKGSDAEDLFCDKFFGFGYLVLHYSDQIKAQRQGYDVILICNSICYGFDIKGNLDTNGEIVIEYKPDGWLYNPEKQSEYIAHVCNESQWMVFYKRKYMQQFIKESYIDFNYNDPKGLVYMQWLRYKNLPFVKTVDLRNETIITGGQYNPSDY